LPAEDVLSVVVSWLGGRVHTCCLAEGCTPPATFVKNAVSFPVKTSYADLYGNTTEMLSCIPLLFTIEVTFNRNYSSKTGEQAVLWKESLFLD